MGHEFRPPTAPKRLAALAHLSNPKKDPLTTSQNLPLPSSTQSPNTRYNYTTEDIVYMQCLKSIVVFVMEYGIESRKDDQTRWN